MLSLGNLSTQVHFKPHLQNHQHFYFKPQFLFFTHFNSNPKITSGVCLKPIKAKKDVNFTEIEMDGSDEFDDDEFFDDDDEYLSGDDDIEDEVIVPLENMKKWAENKPVGFGQGKDYDTSIEDKLMEEIEQSKTAQLANVNKLKHNPVKPPGGGSGKDKVKNDKVPVNIPEGFGVRLVNLPKKKNIHRDLKLAFKGVPGLLNIVPVVAGNEKTRDPLCKGLAFVYFKSHDEARRFVQNFSDQEISFGRNQKKITCEMMDRKLPNPQRDPPVVTKHLKIRSSDEHLNAVLNKVKLALDTDKPSSSREHNDAEQMSSLVQPEDNDTDTETEFSEVSSASVSNVVIDLEPGKDFTSNSTPTKKERKPKPDKKKVSKPKKDKSPKLNIPGSSSSRLKVRDKAMLTDVFSKYGSSATATVTQNSN